MTLSCTSDCSGGPGSDGAAKDPRVVRARGRSEVEDLPSEAESEHPGVKNSRTILFDDDNHRVRKLELLTILVNSAT